MLLAILAAATLTLLDWPDRFRRVWPVFAACVLAGLAGGRMLAESGRLDLLLLGAALLCATVAALAGARAGCWLALPPLVAAGLAVGAAALPEPGAARDVAITAAGAVIGANLPVLVAGGAVDWLSERLSGPVLPLALRVVASWIGAVALMLLAFLLRPAG